MTQHTYLGVNFEVTPVDADFLFEELLKTRLKREETKLRKQYARIKR